MPVTIIISLFLAVIANEKLKGIGLFRTIFSSSMGISVAAASVFWLYLFHPSMGLFNHILEAIGFDKIGWLTDPTWALLSVSLSTIWMNIGFTFLILLGGLQSIDPTYMKVQILMVLAIFINYDELPFPCFHLHCSLLSPFQLLMHFKPLDKLTC